MFSRKDLLIAPLLEAALLFIVALVGWLTQKPFIFASLGPTAYELIETPERQTARPYNVIVGHLIGVVAGFLGIYLTNAWNAPNISSGAISPQRIGACIIAAGLTVFLTLLLKASQSAAVATTLLIALGVLQRGQDAFIIIGSVILISIPGEALRSWRLKDLAKRRQQAFWRA
jgi:CBS domain-containing membrane protein